MEKKYLSFSLFINVLLQISFLLANLNEKTSISVGSDIGLGIALIILGIPIIGVLVGLVSLINLSNKKFIVYGLLINLIFFVLALVTLLIIMPSLRLRLF